MPERDRYDAIVVGSGPNGLAAAIVIARAGHSVLVIEAEETIGGGTRSAEVTLPGFVHDICSAAHPLGAASPLFNRLPLSEYGLEWVHPPAPLAHPLDGGRAAVLERSIQATGETLGADAGTYTKLMTSFVDHWRGLVSQLLGPLRLPRHPLVYGLFGLPSLLPARAFAGAVFRGDAARAMFAGMAGHSMLSLDEFGTTGFGLLLGVLGHAAGWPLARGGSQRIADALTAYLRSLGGEVVTGWHVRTLDELPRARATLFDVTPRQFVGIAGEHLPPGYRRRLEGFRYGPGVFKIDWALDGPIPWQAPVVARAGTVHLGGTLPEIAAAERAVSRSEHPERPLVLLIQPTLFDPSRAPAGRHTAWAYCHVPNGSTVDMTSRIEAQVERFAPGFRDCILERRVMPPAAMQRHNANYIGGDINGGIQDLRQFFTRPVARISPYTTPVKSLYICSSSTPPGGGVHGMCGYWAARAALHDLF